MQIAVPLYPALAPKSHPLLVIGLLASLACAAVASAQEPSTPASTAGAVVSPTVAASDASAAAASAVQPRPLSLTEAITSALARNFDVRSSRETVRDAAGQLESAQGAYDPTVNFSAERSHTDNESATSTDGIEGNSTTATASLTGLLSTGATYTVAADLARNSSSSSTTTAGTFGSTVDGNLALIEISQPLLKGRSIDSSRLALRLSGIALQAANFSAQTQALDTVSAVEQAYYVWLGARETVRVQQSTLALAQQSLADTRQRIKLGALSPLDERDAQALEASSQADLLSAEQSLREAENALLSLITDDFAAWRTQGITPTDALTTETVPVDASASAARALADRPELSRLALVVKQRELSTTYSENQRLPSLNVVGSYSLQGADSSVGGVVDQWTSADHSNYTLGLTVSIPWGNRSSRGSLASARAQQEQARLLLQQERETILGEVDSAVAAVRTSAGRLSATREAESYAQAAYSGERAKLASGTTTSFAVLQLQRNLASAQADAIQALADYNRALSVLRRREGATLSHWGISFTAAADSSAS